MTLTFRQIECLEWAQAGKTAYETGVILGITERTVGYHLQEAMKKLDCHTKLEAVSKAVALGLLTNSG